MAGRALAIRWVLLVASAVGGGLAYWLLANRPAVTAISYLAALAIAVAALELGSLNIRLAGRISVALTLPVALISYLTTTVVLGLLLAAADPGRVSGPAVSVGLTVGSLIWVATAVAGSWVSRNMSEKPVNIRPRDAPSSNDRSRGQS